MRESALLWAHRRFLLIATSLGGQGSRRSPPPRCFELNEARYVRFFANSVSLLGVRPVEKTPSKLTELAKKRTYLASFSSIERVAQNDAYRSASFWATRSSEPRSTTQLRAGTPHDMPLHGHAPRTQPTSPTHARARRRPWQFPRRSWSSSRAPSSRSKTTSTSCTLPSRRRA